MPPRAKKPAEPSAFELAQTAYDNLVAAEPIVRDELVAALDGLKQAGQEALTAKQVTGGGLARVLRNRYAVALEQNEAGNVRPPLEDADVQGWGAQVAAWEMVAGQEPDDTPPKPSRPEKTDDRKKS
ncbi:MAG TPA: hypothetical protein VLF40_05755 [Candidatus Saccharimonadales bacterium]|nr:hypothetical protein [Candidatus Saccharimonadales bacterium]